MLRIKINFLIQLQCRLEVAHGLTGKQSHKTRIEYLITSDDININLMYLGRSEKTTSMISYVQQRCFLPNWKTSGTIAKDVNLN